MFRTLWNSFKAYNKRIFKCTRGGIFQDIGRAFGIIPKKKIDLSPIMQAPLPPKSLTDFPVGKDLEATIRKGIATGGRGFDPSFVERTTSPVIAQREARFRRVERPAAEASFGARGLARSTIAGREIGELGAQKERDINLTLAEAFRADEVQKASDRARNEALAFGFSQAEANVAGNRAAEQVRRGEIAVGAEQIRNIRGEQDINRLIQTGLTLAGGVRAGETFAGFQSGGTGGTQQGFDIQSLLREQQRRKIGRTASPFTAAIA